MGRYIPIIIMMMTIVLFMNVWGKQYAIYMKCGHVFHRPYITHQAIIIILVATVCMCVSNTHTEEENEYPRGVNRLVVGLVK